MRKAVIISSDISKDKYLRMSPNYIFKQIDEGKIKDQSKTLRYKLNSLLRRIKRCVK